MFEWIIKTDFVGIILLRSCQVSWSVYWFQVKIGGWIYQNCPEQFLTFHRPRKEEEEGGEEEVIIDISFWLCEATS